MGKIIWLGLAVLVIVAGVGASQKANNDMARIGGYFFAAAGVLWFLSALAWM
jgi:hypothetical protein